MINNSVCDEKHEYASLDKQLVINRPLIINMIWQANI